MIFDQMSLQASQAAALWWELEDLKRLLDPMEMYSAPTLLIDLSTIEAFQRRALVMYGQAMCA